MGCDIHCYIEYMERGETYWFSFGDRINPGRNYTLFGLLAGVRVEGIQLFPLRGVPADMSYAAESDYWILISDECADSEGFCSKDRAASWVAHGSRYSDDGSKVTNPDWHSHSWLTFDEFKRVLSSYHAMALAYPAIEYDAVLAAMKSLSKHGDVRIVFWFDN